MLQAKAVSHCATVAKIAWVNHVDIINKIEETLTFTRIDQTPQIVLHLIDLILQIPSLKYLR